MTARKMVAFIVIIAGILPMVASAQEATGRRYKRDLVQPVELSRATDGRLGIRYAIPAESLYYSPGVDFAVHGDTLQITIVRCAINARCEAMARTSTPSADAWHADVSIPYAGQRVLMLYADGQAWMSP